MSAYTQADIAPSQSQRPTLADCVEKLAVALGVNLSL
jgi:hypothetical protein